MALASIPAYPVVDETVTIDDAAIASDVQVFELTSVPSASALVLGLLQSPSTATQTSAFAIAAGDLELADFVPDVAGEYGFTVYGFNEYTAAGADEQRLELSATSTGTAHVGEVVTLPILTLTGTGAVLSLTVNDSTVRAAALLLPTNEKARAAILLTAVTTPLAALVGQTVTAIGRALQTDVNELRTKYAAHRIIEGSIHTAADSVNSVPTDDADSQLGAIELLNLLLEAILKHMKDSTADATGWHTVDDLANLPLVGAASNLATATVLSADLRERVYEAHRLQIASPAVHGASGDTTNSLTAPSLLDAVIVALLDALADPAPTAATGEPDGAVLAGSRFGFDR